MSKKLVYLFPEGNATMRDLLGGKGANLCEMTNIGLPVPPGFTITTEACNDYIKLAAQIPRGAVGRSGRGARRSRKGDGQEARRCRRTRCSFPSAPARSSPCRA